MDLLLARKVNSRKSVIYLLDMGGVLLAPISANENAYLKIIKRIYSDNRASMKAEADDEIRQKIKYIRKAGKGLSVFGRLKIAYSMMKLVAPSATELRNLVDDYYRTYNIELHRLLDAGRDMLIMPGAEQFLLMAAKENQRRVVITTAIQEQAVFQLKLVQLYDLVDDVIGLPNDPDSKISKKDVIEGFLNQHRSDANVIFISDSLEDIVVAKKLGLFSVCVAEQTLNQHMNSNFANRTITSLLELTSLHQEDALLTQGNAPQ